MVFKNREIFCSRAGARLLLRKRGGCIGWNRKQRTGWRAHTLKIGPGGFRFRRRRLFRPHRVQGGEHRFDVREREFGGVQQGKHGRFMGGGEHVGQSVAQCFDGVGEIGRQQMAVSDEQKMALGGGAEWRARGLGIGGASCGMEVWRIERNAADRGGDVGDMAAQYIGEDAIEIGEMPAYGGGRHPDGGSEAGKGEGGSAKTRHQRLGCGENAFLLRQLAGRQARPAARKIIDTGTQKSKGDGHGSDNRNCVRNWASGIGAREGAFVNLSY